MNRAATWRRMRKVQPFTVREWEAVVKLEADLAYRLPSGRAMKHVVLERPLADALLRRLLRTKIMRRP
jgi:hypothetical protein